MTRHILTAKKNADVDFVVVGYDRPLSTFFAQAYKNTDGEPDFKLWVGCTLQEIPYAADLIDRVSQYAHIPADLWETLDDDRICAPFRSMDESNAVTHWSAEHQIDPADAPTTEQAD
jgi:hypothetical protein